LRRLRRRAGGCGGAEVLCWPKRSVCGCLRGSCPGDFPDNFYLEALDHHHRRRRSLPASQGAWPLPGSNSMTLLLPCTHMLTRTAISHLHRSLAIFTTTGAARRPAVVPTPPRPFPRRRAPRALPLRAHALRPRLQGPRPLCSAGGWRATWGGQCPVGACSLVPPGTAEPSRLDRR